MSAVNLLYEMKFILRRQKKKLGKLKASITANHRWKRTVLHHPVDIWNIDVFGLFFFLKPTQMQSARQKSYMTQMEWPMLIVQNTRFDKYMGSDNKSSVCITFNKCAMFGEHGQMKVRADTLEWMKGTVTLREHLPKMALHARCGLPPGSWSTNVFCLFNSKYTIMILRQI